MSAFMPPLFDKEIDEPVDVVRIRLWNRQNVTALLSECQSVDRVLENWASRPDSSPVEFEVTFVDGYVVQGCHEFFQRGKRMCLFGTHLKRLLRNRTRESGSASSTMGSGMSRYFVSR
jgi:hypothetical protein